MTRAKILVVDDEQMNVELLEDFLANDYDVTGACNGAETLLIVDNDPPDIILLDVMMPEMDGYEVCKKLKENPKTMMIPIIMVTALQKKEDRFKAFEMFADDFLSKPIDFDELSLKVRTLLRIKQYHDSLAGDCHFLL